MNGGRETTPGPMLNAALDAIEDAVAEPSDPRIQADIAASVITEIFEAVEWRTGLDPTTRSTKRPADPDFDLELSSLTLVLEQCQAHRLRMGQLQRSRYRSS